MKAPKNWSEVTVEQYYNLLEAISMDWGTAEDKSIAMLSALSGVSIRALNEDIDFKHVIKALKNLDFITEPYNRKNAQPILKVGKRKFEVDLNIRGSSASSFISFSDFTSKDKAKTNIHNILSIYSYELGWFGRRKKRTASSQKEIAEYFRVNLTMDKAFDYSGFFLKSWDGLQKATLTYLAQKNKEIVKDLVRTIEQDS